MKFIEVTVSDESGKEHSVAFNADHIESFHGTTEECENCDNEYEVCELVVGGDIVIARTTFEDMVRALESPEPFVTTSATGCDQDEDGTCEGDDEAGEATEEEESESADDN